MYAWSEGLSFTFIQLPLLVRHSIQLSIRTTRDIIISIYKYSHMSHLVVENAE